jgi:pyruvate,water dikinase
VIFLTNKESTKIWHDSLIKETDALDQTLRLPVEWFLKKENFIEFEKQLDNYLPIFIRVNVVPDYLPIEVLEKASSFLEKARNYSEHAYHDVDKLFKRIANQIGEVESYDPQLLYHLLNNEVRDYLETRRLPSKTELIQRQRVSGLYVNQDGNVLLNTNEIQELEELIANKTVAKNGELRGTISSKGYAKGIVRIISNPHSVKVFNEGDILITSMTNPEFLPLMKKAGAIVTEGGGVLSHAAIVSRELNKPCLLNVKAALKVFKDGDMVEVDANNGTVRLVTVS